jgi:hypothetical protein
MEDLAFVYFSFEPSLDNVAVPVSVLSILRGMLFFLRRVSNKGESNASDVNNANRRLMPSAMWSAFMVNISKDNQRKKAVPVMISAKPIMREKMLIEK